MERVKNCFVFILTVGVIALCAMLPRIYARVQDSLSDDKIEYEDMKTVSFEKELYLLEKMFLLRDGLRVSVQDDRAVKTESEIQEILYTEMEYFRDLEMFFQVWDGQNIFIEPMLFFYSDSRNTSGTFWLVQCVWDGSEDCVSLWIDDETGMILSIDYQTTSSVYQKDQLEVFLNVLYSYYFERLALWGDEKVVQEIVEYNSESNRESNHESSNEYDTAASDGLETKKLGRAITFTLRDELYGDLGLYFCVYENGFFLTFT